MIDLKNIFQMQRNLDKLIYQQHDVSYETIFPELKLALCVELAEFANELRCFKFWSWKEPLKKNILLEEYVDGIHFITSLGIKFYVKEMIDLDDVKQISITKQKKELTNYLLDLIKGINKIKNKRTCYAWMVKYWSFGLAIGFSLNDILIAYKQKNDINHQRQHDKY